MFSKLLRAGHARSKWANSNLSEKTRTDHLIDHFS